MMAALVPVALVVLALVALVVVKATGGSGAAPPASKVATSGSLGRNQRRDLCAPGRRVGRRHVGQPGHARRHRGAE